MLFIAVLLVLDAMYLYATRNVTSAMLRRIQGPGIPMRLGSVVFTYLCIAGILYGFILRLHRSPAEAFVLGFCLYGVYEGTNYAILKNWSLQVAVMDTVWGGTLFALTTLTVRALTGR